MPLITGKLVDRRALIQVGLQPSLHATSCVSPDTAASPFDIQPLRGLIDTGAQVTCITKSTARAMNLQPVGRRQLQSVSNIQVHKTYTFVLGVWYGDDNHPSSQKGYYGFEPVLGCDFYDNNTFDVLIGMDIISQGDFSTKRSGDFYWDLYH